MQHVRTFVGVILDSICGTDCQSQGDRLGTMHGEMGKSSFWTDTFELACLGSLNQSTFHQYIQQSSIPSQAQSRPRLCAYVYVVYNPPHPSCLFATYTTAAPSMLFFPSPCAPANDPNPAIVASKSRVE